MWTPIVASQHSFFNNSRDLPDLHSFAPLRPQHISKFRREFSACFSVALPNLKARVLKSKLYLLLNNFENQILTKWNVVGISQITRNANIHRELQNICEMFQNKFRAVSEKSSRFKLLTYSIHQFNQLRNDLDALNGPQRSRSSRPSSRRARRRPRRR